MSNDWWIELAGLKYSRAKMVKTISKLRSKLSMLESENNNLKAEVERLKSENNYLKERHLMTEMLIGGKLTLKKTQTGGGDDTR